MMKKLFSLMLLLATILTFTACISGDEIWGLRIGQSHNSVAKNLKKRGYDIADISESYISIDEKVEYHGIEWDAVTCWFDDNNKLKGIEFDTYCPRPDYQIERLGECIKKEGYPDLKEDTRTSGVYISDKTYMKVALLLPGGIDGRVKLHYYKVNQRDDK